MEHRGTGERMEKNLRGGLVKFLIELIVVIVIG